MKPVSSRLMVGILSCAVALGGCATPLRPKASKLSIESVPPLAVPGSVAVRAQLTGQPGRTLHLAGPDVVVTNDEFSTAIAARLMDALEARRVMVAPDAPQWIEIQVLQVALQPTMTFDCVIDFTRKLSDGSVRGVQSRATNWNLETACGDAASQAVIDILRDPELRAAWGGR